MSDWVLIIAVLMKLQVFWSENKEPSWGIKNNMAEILPISYKSKCIFHFKKTKRKTTAQGAISLETRE